MKPFECLFYIFVVLDSNSALKLAIVKIIVILFNILWKKMKYSYHESIYLGPFLHKKREDLA
jgi:hypothetical protein